MHLAKNKSSLLERLFMPMLLVGTYYSSYRYPFQIGATTTSPTYRDTPAWLSLGKYLLILAFVSALVLYRSAMAKAFRVFRPGIFVIYSYLFVAACALGAAVKDFSLIESGFFYSIPIALHLYHGHGLKYATLNRFLNWLVIISILSNVVQIMLFFLFGRLPALAFKGTILVRFGSFLDDPNGFGLVVALLWGFSWIYYAGWRRVVIVTLLFVSLILTQSLTAIFGVFAAVAVYFAIRIAQSRSAMEKCVLVGVPVFLILILFGWYFFDFSVIIDAAFSFYLLKKRSILAHASVLSNFNELETYQMLGLAPQGMLGESGYINLLGNFGPMYVLAHVVIGLYAALKYFDVLRNGNSSRASLAFSSGAFCFVFTVLICSTNLPMEQVFPINFLYVSIVGLATSNVLSEGSTRTEPQREDRLT